MKIKIQCSDTFLVLSNVFSSSPESVREVLAEFITSVNFNMRLGQFIIDYRDGEILFESELPLEGVSNNEDLAELIVPLIHGNIATHRRHVAALTAIIEKGVTVETAIKMVAKGDEIEEMKSIISALNEMKLEASPRNQASNAGKGDAPGAMMDSPSSQLSSPRGYSEDNKRSYLDVRKFTQVVGELGKGGMGAAYHCIYAASDVVVKEVLDEDNLQRFIEEINLQSKINHQNLVSVIGIIRAKVQQFNVNGQTSFRILPDNSSWLMVIQYCAKGSLSKWLSEVKNGLRPFDEVLAVRIVEEVALGMAMLHDRQILHNDLKPDNVFLNEDYHALVGDFGLAVKLKRRLNIEAMVSAFQTTFKGAGTLYYIAPECFTQRVVSRASDVFSFAIILHNVFVTQCELETYDQHAILNNGNVLQFNRIFVEKLTTGGIRPYLPAQTQSPLSPMVKNVIFPLMMRCWDADPKQRPKFEDIAVILRDLRMKISAAAQRPLIMLPSALPEINSPPSFVRGVSAGTPATNAGTGGAPFSPPGEDGNFVLVNVVAQIKTELKIDANTRMDEALLQAAEILGITEDCAALTRAKDKASLIAKELGIM